MSRRIVAEFDAVTGPFLQKMDRIDRSVRDFERSTMRGFSRVEGGVNSLVTSASRLRNVMGVVATGFGASMGTQFLDQASLIRNAMREAGDTTQETYEKVFQSSVRALTAFDLQAKGVQRFHKALRDDQSLDETIRQVETLNKLLALGGKTTQERNSTFIQFSQALQSGVLQGEELRALRESAPIELVREIAAVAGGTIESLKDMAKEGELTTAVMRQALINLEEEADRRFKLINVTISDAAQVFRSGAIVAAEGFDKGLGLSRATVSGLKNVGEILGENAEAAQMWGEAVKVAGAVLATSYAGRRISDVSAGIAEHRKELYSTVTALEARVAATNKANEAAKRRLVIADTALTKARATNATEKQLTAATTRHASAVRNATAASAAHASAIAAADAAQNRLLLSTRLATGALSALKGAFAFLGGWPGIILTIGSALYFMRDASESAAEKMDRLTDRTGTLSGETDNLKSLHQDLIRLSADRASAEDDATNKIIASTKREFEAKKSLLQLSRVDAQKMQADRVRELMKLKNRRDTLPSADQRYQTNVVGSGAEQYMTETQRAAVRQRLEAEASQERADLERDIKRLQAVVDLSAEDLMRSAEALSLSFEDGSEALAAGAEVRADLLKDYGKAMTEFTRLLDAQKKAQEGLAAATERDDRKAIGEWSAAITEIDGRLQKMRGTSGTVGEGLAELITITDSLQSVMGAVQFDDQGQLRAEIATVEERLDAALANVQDLDAAGLGQLYAAVNNIKSAVDDFLGSMGLLRSELENPYSIIARFEQASPGSTDRGAWSRSAEEAAAKGIRDLIGYAEGTDKGRKYNETLGYGKFTGGDVDLVNMTLREVLDLQKKMLAHPDNTFNSSAVGRYQIVSATLRDLIKDLRLSLDEQFTPALQDRLADQLVRRRRGQGVEGMRNEWEGLRHVGAETIRRAQSAQVIPSIDGDLKKTLEDRAKEAADAAEERLREVKSQEEQALKYVEAVMTRQESQAHKLKEMTDLRKQLVATYGEEHQLVAQLDKAISRTKSAYQEVSDAAKQMFGILSENIAGSIEEWKGWGNLIRNILADLVRAEGVNFFISLLTPGAQKGSSLGTRFGNFVTGNGFAEVLHDGGRQGALRRVNPDAWIGAPRFHDGLMPGEFRAILERGETVLPKGVSPVSGSASLTIVNHNDFSNAESGMKQWIEGQLSRRDKEFQSKWLNASRAAKEARME